MGIDKPSMYIFSVEQERLQKTFEFLDASGHVELVIRPSHIDYREQRQKANVGFMERKGVFASFTEISYASRSELIELIRDISPRIRTVRTLVPDTKKDLVIY
jgi:hypothetical protein